MAYKLLGFLLLCLHSRCAQTADDAPLMRRQKRKKQAAGGTLMTDVEVDSHGDAPTGEGPLMRRQKRKNQAPGGTRMTGVEADSHGDVSMGEKNMATEMQGQANDVVEIDSSGIIRNAAQRRQNGLDRTSEDTDPEELIVEEQNRVPEEGGPKGEGEEDDDGLAFEAKMIGQVSVSKGDIADLFDYLDEDGDGILDKHEGKTILTFFPDRSDFNWHEYTDIDDGHISKTKFKQAAFARLSLGPPRLCDAKIVAALCARLNGDTNEYYDTAADANTSVVHAKEIAETLSTPAKNVVDFFHEIGATNEETDADAKKSGAFGVTCVDLCQKTIESVPKERMPPASSVACRLDEVEKIKCDIDVSLGTAWMRQRQRPMNDEDAPDAVLSNDTPSFQDTGMPISGTPAIMEELLRSGEWSESRELVFEGYTVDELKISVANLFSIFPATPAATDPANFLQTDANQVSAQTIAQVGQRVAAAQAWVAETITRLAEGGLSCHIAKWFRVDDGSTRPFILNMFNSISRENMHQHIILNSPTCQPAWTAFVYKGFRKNGGLVVHYCPAYWPRPYDHQISTVIHEMSHHFGTLDHSGDWNYLQQPNFLKPYALNNAYSFNYFSDDVNAGDRLTGRPGRCGVISSRRRTPRPTPRPTPAPKPGLVIPCFPGDASVWVENVGQRKLQDLRHGEVIAVADPQLREVRYEPVLGDFHSEEEHKQTVEFLMITHEYGTLNASSTHYLNTIDYGYLPTRDVKVGYDLLVRTGDDIEVKPSKVLGICNVTKLGIYAPFTFGGTLLVDGVLASAYTDLTWAFLPPQAQERILTGIGGHDSLNNLMHVLALPLRTAYYFGIPDLVAGIPFLRRFFKPDPQNSDGATNDHMPKYVDWVGRLTGAFLESIY